MPGSSHTAVSAQVCSLLCSPHVFKGEVAAWTWNNPPSPHLPPQLPEAWSFRAGEMSAFRKWGANMYSANGPKALPETSARIREGPGRGRSSPALPVQPGELAMIQEAGEVLVLTLHLPTVQTSTTAPTSLGFNFPVCQMGWSG